MDIGNVAWPTGVQRDFTLCTLRWCSACDGCRRLVTVAAIFEIFPTLPNVLCRYSIALSYEMLSDYMVLLPVGAMPVLKRVQGIPEM